MTLPTAFLKIAGLIRFTSPAAAANTAAAVTAVYADTNQPAPEFPTCDKKIGTLGRQRNLQDPWWTAMQLDSPGGAHQGFTSRSSKCFYPWLNRR